MLLPSADPNVTIQRILKVNHAGEAGAIRIYRAQIAIARRRFPEIVPALQEMLDDEIEHCRLFRDAMRERRTRPCRVMSLWSLGGYVLGLATAVLGQRMVWICTEAVEATVHQHLEEQLRFLETRDPSLYGVISAIQAQELAHLNGARDRQNVAKGASGRAAFVTISALTNTLIWLSTWGDSTWIVPEMTRAR